MNELKNTQPHSSIAALTNLRYTSSLSDIGLSRAGNTNTPNLAFKFYHHMYSNHSIMLHSVSFPR